MTTAIVHGDPGSRKTATLVSEYGIPALYQGRTVVTNIRGFIDIAVIEAVYKKKLPESAKLIAVPFTRDGFRKMGTFFHWAPVGALILMDEGQRVYPTRLRSLDMYDCKPPRKSGYVDKATGVEEDIGTVEEAFDCHRHMNWDIYISTPNIEKVHKEIRQVAEYGYRQKDLASVHPLFAKIFGDFKRAKHNAETKGTSDGQILSSSNHRVDKRAFKCYQSTATGVAKGTHTKAGLFSQPKLLCILLFLAFTAYRFGDNYFTYGSFFPDNAQLRAVDNPGSVGVAVSDVSAAVGSVNAQAVSMGAEGVPLQAADFTGGHVSDGGNDSGLGLNLYRGLYSWVHTIQVGEEITHYVEVKECDNVFVIDSRDLAEMGLSIQARASFVIVTYQQHSRIVYTVRHEFKDKQENVMIIDPANGTPI